MPSLCSLSSSSSFPRSIYRPCRHFSSTSRSYLLKKSRTDMNAARTRTKTKLDVGGLGKRGFASSVCQRDHYATLGIPHTATKAQIKSHFYKLSKKYHPDVSTDPKAPEMFSKVSEAYTVLSNDRDRRAYDRSLLHRPTHTPTYPGHTYHPRAPSSRRGATFAWESRRRSQQQHQQPHFYPQANSSGGHYDPRKPPSQSHSAHRDHPSSSSTRSAEYATSRQEFGFDPRGRPQFTYSSHSAYGYGGQGRARPEMYHDVLTGSRMREEEEARVVDRINRDSTVWRAVQLSGAIAVGVGCVWGLNGFGWG